MKINEFMMKYFFDQNDKGIKLFYIFIILLIQNVSIFHNHYFNDTTPPWDFVETYLAVPFYWIELLRNGYDVSWIPFQGMGYPLYMNLQSGYYYLPNWIFVIFDIQYTINNAVIMQCLHIFIGSLGAVILAYLIGLKWYKALLTGFIYQTFGAFYSNAEHLDIIRGYSFIPWLLIPVLTKQYFTKLNQIVLYLYPLIVFFMITGGYLGMSIAIFFILGITTFIRILFEKEYRKYGFFVIVTLLIGFLVSSVFLLPSLLDKKELIRATGIVSYDYAYLVDIFSLIFGIGFPSQPHDLSMQSSSISMIVFMLLISSLLKVKVINKWLLFILLLALLMISGLLHQYLVQIFPPLGLSRMIMSDYRGLIGIIIILIAIIGLKNFTRKDLLPVIISTLIFIALGNFFLNINPLDYKKEFLLTVISFLLSIGTLYIFTKKALLGITFMFIMVILDFYRIHSSKIYWSHKDASLYIKNTYGEYKDFSIQLLDKVSGKEFREKRLDEQKRPFSYKGYYSGTYMMNDYGGSMHLKQYENIRSNSILKSYALLEWTPISGNINIIDNENVNNKVNFIKLESYKTSEIKYSINSIENTSFIENEIYWKGWKGKLIDEKGNMVYEILPENIDGFRKWNVPKGEYTLIANFIPPYEKIAINISIAGIFIWLIFIYYIRRKHNDKKLTRI